MFSFAARELFFTRLTCKPVDIKCRGLTTAQVLAELVKLAKQMRANKSRAKELGLSEDEIAFYDAVIQNDAAIMELGDETLKTIAKKLVTTVRNSKTIDWIQKESVRAKMRSRIRRLLAIYGYPPDKQESAIKLVIEQAEHLSSIDT